MSFSYSPEPTGSHSGPFDPEAPELPEVLQQLHVPHRSEGAVIVVAVASAPPDRDWADLACIRAADMFGRGVGGALLLDTDVGSPGLTRRLGVSSLESLQDVLQDIDALDRVAGFAEGHPFLFVPAGSPAGARRPLLEHESWGDLLHRVTRDGTTVVVHVQLAAPGVESIIDRADAVVLLGRVTDLLAVLVEGFEGPVVWFGPPAATGDASVQADPGDPNARRVQSLPVAGFEDGIPDEPADVGEGTTDVAVSEEPSPTEAVEEVTASEEPTTEEAQAEVPALDPPTTGEAKTQPRPDAADDLDPEAAMVIDAFFDGLVSESPPAPNARDVEEGGVAESEVTEAELEVAEPPVEAEPEVAEVAEAPAEEVLAFDAKADDDAPEVEEEDVADDEVIEAEFKVVEPLEPEVVRDPAPVDVEAEDVADVEAEAEVEEAFDVEEIAEVEVAEASAEEIVALEAEALEVEEEDVADAEVEASSADAELVDGQDEHVVAFDADVEVEEAVNEELVEAETRDDDAAATGWDLEAPVEEADLAEVALVEDDPSRMAEPTLEPPVDEAGVFEAEVLDGSGDTIEAEEEEAPDVEVAEAAPPVAADLEVEEILEAPVDEEVGAFEADAFQDDEAVDHEAVVDELDGKPAAADALEAEEAGDVEAAVADEPEVQAVSEAPAEGIDVLELDSLDDAELEEAFEAGWEELVDVEAAAAEEAEEVSDRVADEFAAFQAEPRRDALVDDTAELQEEEDLAIIEEELVDAEVALTEEPALTGTSLPADRALTALEVEFEGLPTVEQAPEQPRRKVSPVVLAGAGVLAVAAAAFALIGRDPPADASGSADLPTVEPDAEEVQVAEEDPWAGDPLSAFGEDEGQEAAPEETTDGGAPAAAAFPESGDAQPTPSVAEGPEPVPAVPTPAEGQPDAQSSTQPDAPIAELDAEPEPAEPDAEPEPAEPDAEPEAVATDSEPEPVATEPEPEPVATDPEPEPAEPEPEPEPVAEEPTPSPTEQPVEEPAVPPAPEEDPATTAEPAPEAAETPVEETGPPPAPEITAPDLTPPPPNTGVEPGTMAFGVVVGRHGSFGAARSQAMSLRSDNSGVMFNVVPVDEGEVVYRVVAGPAATRADAEQIQSSLGDVAFGTAATVRATQWTYLLGVFGDYAEAITTVTGVQSAGLPAYLVEIPVGEDRVVYRAYSGAFATEAEAAALGTLLEEAGFGPTRLVERVGRPMR